MKSSIPLYYLGLLAAFPLVTFDLYQPALPAMTEYFHTSHSIGQLTLGINLFFYGLAQLVWGPLIDRHGRKPMLKISLYGFMLASLICICAPNIYVMLLGRAMQGAFGCCANVLAFSSTRDIEDGNSRARSISHIAMILALSPILGPLIGGYVYVLFDWQANFVLMLMMAIVLQLLGFIAVNESLSFKRKLYQPKLRYQIKRYLLVLKQPLVRRSIVIQSATFCMIMSVIVNISYLLIDNLQVDPIHFGYYFGLNGFMIIIGNFLGIKLRTKYSTIWNIRLGSVIMIFGAVLMNILNLWKGLSLETIACVLLISFGSSLINPPVMSMALSRLPILSGTITGVINTIRSIASSVYSAIIGALVYYSFSTLPISLFCLTLVCLFVAFIWYQETLQKDHTHQSQ